MYHATPSPIVSNTKIESDMTRPLLSFEAIELPLGQLVAGVFESKEHKHCRYYGISSLMEHEHNNTFLPSSTQRSSDTPVSEVLAVFA